MCKISNLLIYRYIVLNEKTKEHIRIVRKQLFSKSDKVLGVLCRGTDYNSHPSKHPIQPEPHRVESDAQQILTGVWQCFPGNRRCRNLQTVSGKIWRKDGCGESNQICGERRDYNKE